MNLLGSAKLAQQVSQVGLGWFIKRDIAVDITLYAIAGGFLKLLSSVIDDLVNTFSDFKARSRGVFS